MARDRLMRRRTKETEDKTGGLGALLDEAEAGREKAKARRRKDEDDDLNFDAAFDRH